MMKKLLICTVAALASLAVPAQTPRQPFRAYIYNNEYDVFLDINLYHDSIAVPGQDLYGLLPGYLGRKGNSFCWVITSAKVKGDKAQLSLINDYGSEDLTATLTLKEDSIYVLRQEEGSTLKVPKNGKWQKLPKTLEFKKSKRQVP